MNSNTSANGVVLLYSYRRPKLTQEAIFRLLEWNNLDKLYVSIDGLKDDASLEESNWRSETIQIAEKAKEFSNKIQLLIWDSNLGLTHHGNRALKQIFTFHSKVISLEEDNLISEEGLEFLNNIPVNCGSPHIKSSFSKFRHIDEPIEQKFTIFPEQWGISFNLEMYQRYMEVQVKGTVDVSSVYKQISRVLGKKKIARRVCDHWAGIFLESIDSPNFGDGLMQYAALSSGVFYEVPWQSFTADLGHLDDRGIHSRTKPKKNLHHVSEKIVIDNFTFCLTCEKLNSDWHTFKYFRRLISTIFYKFKFVRVLFNFIFKK